MLLAIDPGVSTGWSLFSAGRKLVACGLGDPRSSPKFKVLDLTGTIIERPLIYPGKTPNPNDVVSLAVNAGEWAGLFRQWAPVEYVCPFQWKGSVPKQIHHARLWAKLDDSEKEIVDSAFKGQKWTQALPPGTFTREGDTGRVPEGFCMETKGVAPGKRHNVLDAIGLGLFKVGRS